MNKATLKTISVPLGKEDYIIALMDKLNFKEVERKATGGYMSEERLQITFEGLKQNYHENDYVKVKSEVNGYYYFYSLRHTIPHFTNNEESFKEIHDKATQNNFEIHSFKID